MKADDNKFLAEQMGECYHEFEPYGPKKFNRPEKCKLCGKDRQEMTMEDLLNWITPFDSPHGFVRAILFAQDDSRHEGWTWKMFSLWSRVHWHNNYQGGVGNLDYAGYTRWLFTPSTFAGVLCEFLRGREK